MKNFTKLTFICTFVLFATLFSEQDQNRQKYLSMGGADSMNPTPYNPNSYYNIVMNYLSMDKQLPKMGKNQYMALEAYSKGTLKISQLRHFEKALKKHPCFVHTKNPKGRKLTVIPNVNATPDWFEIKCPN